MKSKFKHSNTSPRRRFLPLLPLAVGAVAFALFALAPPSQAGGKKGKNKNQNPGVLPVNSRAFGKTYAEWAAAWQQWALSLPVEIEGDPDYKHPLFINEGDGRCDIGQSGKVWFLGGTFEPEIATDIFVSATADRECTIPTGKALFFPILNVVCTNLTDGTEDPLELQECAEFFGANMTDMECTIDGVEIKNLEQYIGSSTLFGVEFPESNVLEIPGPDLDAIGVDNGTYLLLAPLSAGEHEIHFAGAFVFTMEQDGFDFIFELDVTYHLNVVGGGR